ncbi:uncharacterized protein VTP21DRAFT_10702 [Calcarisporiella thermophila]|uniref:uncharacterized protein n=1 Tax=Calcarisporiella thermophila TaxID=911321 RepID=UPI0037440CED
MSSRLRRDDKSQNDKHAKILKDLLQIPENKQCADCKRRDPRWASWNLGIFVCIRCSGIHRSMGTHISRVKSVDLDKWTPQQIESMVQWGNKRANKYWEAKLPENSQPQDSNIEGFIRSKYEYKRWALSSSIPNPDSLGDTGDVTSTKQSSAQLLDTNGTPLASTTNKQTPISPSLIDGFDDFFSSPPPAASTPSSTSGRSTPAASTVSSSGAASDLLNMNDSSTKSAPTKPVSTTSSNNPGANHFQLKSSIMSLYNTANPVRQQNLPTSTGASAFSTASNVGSRTSGDGFGAFISSSSQGSSGITSDLNGLFAATPGAYSSGLGNFGQTVPTAQSTALGGLGGLSGFTAPSTQGGVSSNSSQNGGNKMQGGLLDLWGEEEKPANPQSKKSDAFAGLKW